MINLKKSLALVLALVMVGSLLVSCGSKSDNISVVSREDGSGTRGAFIELFGIEQKDTNGEKVDHTIDTAEVTNSTAVMMQTVAGNEQAIGYISLGSLNDTVKALKIDGVEASVDNIKSGDYKVARPFNIVTGDKLSDAAKDFINYIMSEDGQKIVENEGYVSEGNQGAYKSSDIKGKIVVAGSSSVTPLMEKLAESYKKINTNVTIEVQQSDSTTGVTSTIEGVCDIGMASRALSDDEVKQGISTEAIAQDGIAVIVNLNSTVDELKSDDVLKIYTGEITKWSEIK